MKLRFLISLAILNWGCTVMADDLNFLLQDVKNNNRLWFYNLESRSLHPTSVYIKERIFFDPFSSRAYITENTELETVIYSVEFSGNKFDKKMILSLKEPGFSISDGPYFIGERIWMIGNKNGDYCLKVSGIDGIKYFEKDNVIVGKIDNDCVVVYSEASGEYKLISFEKSKLEYKMFKLAADEYENAFFPYIDLNKRSNKYFFHNRIYHNDSFRFTKFYLVNNFLVFSDSSPTGYPSGSLAIVSADWFQLVIYHTSNKESWQFIGVTDKKM